MKRNFPYLIIALTLLATTPVSAADWVILDSTSPGIKAGSITPGDGVITLAADTQVTVIAPNGETLTLAGPYIGAVNRAYAAIVDPKTGYHRRDRPVGDFPTLDPNYYK